MAEDGMMLFSTPKKKTGKRPLPEATPGGGRAPASKSRKRASVSALSPNEERAHSGKDATSSDAATTFASLGLREHLQRVCSSLGMPTPTPIQAGVVPAVLAGRDCIGVAHTGSGKTAAFALPILHNLARDRFGVYALVLAPTRELAYQIAEQFQALGAGSGVRHVVVVGGMEQQAQALALCRRPHVVVATPGRLAEVLSTTEDVAAGFRRVAVLVLDEADRTLEPTFEASLRTILAVLPKTRQTLLFTATMTQPLKRLRDGVLHDPFVFQAYSGLRTADNLLEQYVLMPAKVREVHLVYLLGQLATFKVRSAMVFCAKRTSCELVSGLLYQLGLPAVSLHGGKPQKARLAALHQFKSGTTQLLVATDVASRGLDIPTVDLVVNFELPVTPEDYVHRVGRTARAGRGGWALTFVSQYDVKLVQKIEEMIGHELAEYNMDEDAVMKDITKVFAARRAALLAIEAKKNVR